MCVCTWEMKWFLIAMLIAYYTLTLLSSSFLFLPFSYFALKIGIWRINPKWIVQTENLVNDELRRTNKYFWFKQLLISKRQAKLIKLSNMFQCEQRSQMWFYVNCNNYYENTIFVKSVIPTNIPIHRNLMLRTVIIVTI